MNCSLFIDQLPEMIENELSEQAKEEMLEHMRYCKACKDEFELMMKFRKEVKYTIEDEELKYESRKTIIMSSIDKDKYKKKKSKLIYRTSIATVAASLVIFLGWYSINKTFLNETNLKDENTKPIVANETKSFGAGKGEENIDSFKVVKAEKDDKVAEAKKNGNGISNEGSIMVGSDDIKNKIASKGDSLEPKKEIVLKQAKQWVGPPRIEYINDNIMVFGVGNFVTAYSLKDSANYSILDLGMLDVAGTQGSQVYQIEYINDSTIAIGTVGEEADNRPIYIIDLINEKAIEIKDFSLNNSNIKADTAQNTVIISKKDFSIGIKLNYREGKYTNINKITDIDYNYSKFELENNNLIKESIYKDKNKYPSLKRHDKIIALYDSNLFVERGNSIYAISKGKDKLLIESVGYVKYIKSNNDEQTIVIEKDKETIIINKKTFDIFRYKNNMEELDQVKYSKNGKYRVVYGKKVIAQSVSGLNKELNGMKDYMFESKITDDGKVIYITLDEESGVKVNIKGLK